MMVTLTKTKLKQPAEFTKKGIVKKTPFADRYLNLFPFIVGHQLC